MSIVSGVVAGIGASIATFGLMSLALVNRVPGSEARAAAYLIIVVSAGVGLFVFGVVA